MMSRIWLMFALLVLGCETEPASEPARAPRTSSATLVVRSSEPAEPSSDPGEAAAVRVYTAKDPGRPCEIVGVLDFHTAADSENKGFDQLRSRAASMGANSVVGAEFEHGDHGEKSHLSGMAARCEP